uniref:Uncharacterized protein n=1 Tax=Nicotiana tabacum TaxID=4097 RepID=A0A1S4B1U6_TOBAC|nr:PREDICTED: uncharacterized protein LOC107803656 [Nicotiana tabacum]
MVGMVVGASLEVPRDAKNAPSDPLGAIEIGGSPMLPSFSEEMIQEARALKTLSIEGVHGREDLFRLEEGPGRGLEPLQRSTSSSESALHREAFSRSRAELSREEEIKDLQAELAKAHQDQSDLIEQLQQKIEVIGQLRDKVDMMKAETLGWKESMDRFAAEKETALSQLSSVESLLRGMKEKSSAQEGKIAELEARLAYELEKAKSEPEKAKAEADAIVAVYRADAEAAQVQARKAAETTKTRAY